VLSSLLLGLTAMSKFAIISNRQTGIVRSFLHAIKYIKSSHLTRGELCPSVRWLLFFADAKRGWC
jgi:hypothetical protein